MRPWTRSATAFNISAVNLLPLALLVLFSILKYPPFLAILGSALFAGILAPFTQSAAVTAFIAQPELGPVATAIKANFAAMATGFVSNSGVEPIDALFSRGGMASLLTTVWLVLGALSFAAVMEHAGFLQRLLAPIVARVRRRGSLILAVNASGIGLNVIAGDQYVADVMPARMFRGEFERRGLAPQVLSRAVEDSGTVTSVLVPWNTCGAYISGVLGVPTAAYFPFCFFNLLSPLLDVLYGYIGFKVPTLDPGGGGGRARIGRHTTAGSRVTREGEDPDRRPAGPRRTSAATREAAAVHAPSAYTILFALIVLMAIATWLIPAGAYDLDKDGAPIPGTYHEVESPAADPDRLDHRPDQRPLRDRERQGQHQLLQHRHPVRSDRRRAVHHRDRRLPRRDDGAPGRSRRGSARCVTRLQGRERWMIPHPDEVFALGGIDRTAWPRRAWPSTPWSSP